jgi:hypothetical protein
VKSLIAKQTTLQLSLRFYAVGRANGQFRFHGILAPFARAG